MTPRFEVTQQVRVRARPDDVGLIWKVHEVGDEPTYEVFFDAQRTTTFAEHALLPLAVDDADASSPVDALRLWQLADAPDFRRFLTLERLTHPLASTVYSYLASKTELLPYQFKPILKLLDNPYGRLLIADEVGLGKTIEAGIILVELNARQPLNRVLVVCPSALTEKWRRELLNRFDLEFEVVRGAQLGEFVRRATERPGRPHHAISSLETLRGASALELLEESRLDFDVVIVDEAHHMRNSWTRSNALGDHLGSVADTMVFLTATPLNLGRLDFFELLHLLVPEEFEDFSSFETQIAPNAHLNEALRAIRATPPDPRRALAELSEIPQLVSRRVGDDPRFADALARVREAAQSDGTIEPGVSVMVQKHLTELNTLSHVFARTRKREVQQLFPLRRAWPVMVEFSEAERKFYEAVSAWVRLANERYGVGVGVFVLMNYQRQLASCMPAMADKLRSTVLSGTMTYTAGEVDDLDEDEELDALLDGDRYSVDLKDLDDERLTARIGSSWNRVQREGVDSKFNAFRDSVAKLLESGERKVLVFSFFIGTINYLARRLSAEGADGRPIRVFKLYGPTPTDERDDVVRAFKDCEEPAVLLSSEVGSEGLDFQFCSSMFNYDLPWNPMRVEQRIGRLDRYGQAADAIQIFNLVVPDTIEGRIFYRLYERINIFQEAIGDLEAILSDQQLDADLRSLKRDVVFGKLDADEQRRRADLIAQVIERKRIDLEEFDEQSKRFVGQDEVFRERFHDIEAGHRYISPDEVRNFVEGYVASRFDGGVRVVAVRDRQGVFRFRGRALSELYELMRTYLLDAAGTSHDFNVAHRICDDERGLCTFDARLATTDEALEFVSIHHPLLQAIAEDLRRHGSLRPAGRIKVPAIDGSPPGPRLAFLFRVISEGIKREIDIVSVVVGTDGRVDEPLTAQLLPLLAAGGPSDLPLEGWLTEDLVTIAEQSARAWVQRDANARESERKRYADAIVAAQLESLRLGYELRLKRLDHRDRSARDQRIQRMLRGTRRNAERRYERKRREIDRQREVSVGTELFAAAVVEVADPAVS